MTIAYIIVRQKRKKGRSPIKKFFRKIHVPFPDMLGWINAMIACVQKLAGMRNDKNMVPERCVQMTY